MGTQKRFRITVTRTTYYVARAEEAEEAVDMVLGAIEVVGPNGVKEESQETVSHTVEELS